MSDKTRVVHVSDNVEGAVYIGRPMPRQRLKGSPIANPFKIGRDGTRRDVISRYESHLHRHPELWTAIAALRGKPISCWCRHDGEAQTRENECHGDVILYYLNHFTDDQLQAMVEEHAA